MKAPNGRTGLLVACATLVIALQAGAIPARGAEPAASVSLGPGSSLWIEGKSNVHDFEGRTSEVKVMVAWDPGASAPATAADIERMVRENLVKALDVEVLVKTLRSGKAGLDKNMWRDLRAETDPTIRFHVSSGALHVTGSGLDTLELHAEGLLRVAGKERPVKLQTRAWRSDAGLWIEGRQPVRMTEFGIKPRTMMLGTLRVRDEVVVRWRLLLVPVKS